MKRISKKALRNVVLANIIIEKSINVLGIMGAIHFFIFQLYFGWHIHLVAEIEETFLFVFMFVFLPLFIANYLLVKVIHRYVRQAKDLMG